MLDQDGNKRLRIYLFQGTLLLAFLILLGGFYRLQIHQADIYARKSEENSIRVLTRFPPRGNIYDRNGELIADTRPSFSVYLIPAQVTPYTIQFVSSILGLDPQKVKLELKKAGRFQPVKVARHVSYEALATIQENLIDLPGVDWKVEPRRHYYYSRCFSHILGTLGEVTEDELRLHPEYELGDLVGKKGIEKTLEPELRGRKGFKYVKVDAMGRIVDELFSERNTPPIPGKNIFLTIDARLQRFADSLFGDKRGALVAVNVKNGEILTLLSEPDYDLNLFIGPIDPAEWQQLTSDSLHPLYDRACQSSYPPGSTYKLVAAIAALNEGIITPRWKAFCPGYYQIGRRTIKCWLGGGHGELDLLGAIKNSCNVYFYQLGLKIGIDLWAKYSNLFQFGKKTGIELTTENPGLVPSREYYDKVYGKGKWTRGMLANLAIGQGELLVTPVQMARFTAMIANKGWYPQLHLILREVDPVKGVEKEPAIVEHSIEGIDPGVYEVIQEGMREVVAGGTGRLANIIGVSVAGKTGTAQNPQGKDHAWFIAFAPFKEPEIAVVVLVENGGSGGAVAAPIAGQFLRRYFYYQGKFDYKEEQRILAAILAKKKEEAKADSLKNLMPSTQ